MALGRDTFLPTPKNTKILVENFSLYYGLRLIYATIPHITLTARKA